MNLNPYALGASGLASLFKIGMGAWQGLKARKMDKNLVRPDLNIPIPEGLKENVRMSRFEAGKSGIPGQGYLENQLGGAAAMGLNAAAQYQQSPAAIAASASAMSANQMDSMVNTAIQGARLKAANMQSLYQNNRALSQAEQDKFTREFQWNKANPYLQDAATISALRGSSQQNIFGGVNDIGALATDALFGLKAHDKIKKYHDYMGEGAGTYMADSDPGTSTSGWTE